MFRKKDPSGPGETLTGMIPDRTSHPSHHGNSWPVTNKKIQPAIITNFKQCTRTIEC